MAMSRQDAINDALARLSDLGFTYGPNYAEHGPMAAEAISTLGHNDAVADWVEAYKKDHRPHPLPPRCQPIDGADEQNGGPRWAIVPGYRTGTTIFARSWRPTPATMWCADGRPG